MSWIKDNKFVVALGGGTLVGVIVIFLAGAKGASRYNQAKEQFDAAVAEAISFEGLDLYPKSENCDGKHKALVEYRQATESLQTAFAKFRPQQLVNVSPQDFTNQLKAVNEEIRKACEESGTTVPEPFFCGFESYKTSLARGTATGILQYELAGIKSLMLALAQSGASEIKNLYRPALPEEDGGEYKPQAATVARPLPLEITFSGPEKAMRAFLSALSKQPNQYFVIRAIAVNNSKQEPPRTSDAKFEKPAPPPSSGGDGFGGGFVLPVEEPKADDSKTGKAPATVPTPAPAPEVIPEVIPEPAPGPPPADTSRILAQVLGNEEVQVFLRLDLLQFLPVKKLP